MTLHPLAGTAIAAAFVLAATGCSSALKTPAAKEVTTKQRQDELTTAMACELGAAGSFTPLLCRQAGGGADLGLSPEPSDFRF